jgi:hypothetical protein
LDGHSRNFWYGVEEDKYLEATVLGSDVVTIKNIIGATETLHDGSADFEQRFVVGLVVGYLVRL